MKAEDDRDYCNRLDVACSHAGNVFLELVQFARAECAAHRARTKPREKSLSLIREKPKALLEEEAPLSSESSLAFVTHGFGSGIDLLFRGVDSGCNPEVGPDTVGSRATDPCSRRQEGASTRPGCFAPLRFAATRNAA